MFLNIGSAVNDSKGNKYVLVDNIGKGGFGYVFKAVRQADNGVFAVKAALPSFRSEEDSLSFQNEIVTALRVQGENVIRYEYVHTGNEFKELPPYIIMEYADGGTLNSIIRDENDEYYDNETLTKFFLQLSYGMKAVNKVLVHRDIKPENILITQGTFKISDFGLAKIASESTRTMTFKGWGTPLYMSPEAWDYTKNALQMDIYSMGIIFYQLATNSYPYRVNGDTLEDYKNAHLYITPVSPERVNHELSPSLASIINKMMEKNPKKRFVGWDEIIELLDNQNCPVPRHEDVVLRAIMVRNKEIEDQKRKESLMRQRKEEEEAFKRKIQAQFESAIKAPIKQFIEDINNQFAGDPIHLFYNRCNNPNWFSYEIRIDSEKFVKISIQCIVSDPNSGDDYGNRFTGMLTQDGKRVKYKGKDVWAFGIVKNHEDLGFNLILVDSGEIYGDWYVLNNKNNLSHISGEIKTEPFYLTKEVAEVLSNITGLYRSEIVELDEKQFINQIEMLAFEK